jgi:lysophospholipase L1-like esterase
LDDFGSIVKKMLVGGAGVAAGLGLASAGAAAYVAKMVQGRATGDIDGFLDRKDSDIGDVVVCLGASIVRGRASVDFVEMLRARLPQLEFVNGGVNSDTADDILQRLDSVIACHPKAIVILVGTSDAQAILNPSGPAAKKKQKETGNTEPPSVANFQRNLLACVSELSERTGARIGLCSLPPLGQDISAPANDVIRALNAAIRTVAESTGETYLPVYEQMVAYLESADATHGKPFTGDWRIGARSLSQHFIIGRSFDVIAEREGLLLSPDYIHLNTAGASIVADEAQAFLAPLANPASVPATEPVVVTEPAAVAEPLDVAAADPVPDVTPAPAPETVQAEAVPAPRPAQPSDEEQPTEASPFEPVASVEPEEHVAPKGGPSPYGG